MTCKTKKKGNSRKYEKSKQNEQWKYKIKAEVSEYSKELTQQKVITLMVVNVIRIGYPILWPCDKLS